MSHHFQLAESETCESPARQRLHKIFITYKLAPITFQNPSLSATGVQSQLLLRVELRTKFCLHSSVSPNHPQRPRQTIRAMAKLRKIQGAEVFAHRGALSSTQRTEDKRLCRTSRTHNYSPPDRLNTSSSDVAVQRVCFLQHMYHIACQCGMLVHPWLTIKLLYICSYKIS